MKYLIFISIVLLISCTNNKIKPKCEGVLFWSDRKCNCFENAGQFGDSARYVPINLKKKDCNGQY